ncbi:MAG: uncharacterized membrane protein (DUF485 family) [Clostridium sp.]|jgi:uncharacterized membrane protein (DUF485 family)
MMNKETVDRIQNDPDYIELLSKRTGFAWTLSIIMLVVYYSYILVIAFNKELLHTPVSEGSLMTLGMPVGVAIIIFSFAMTGIYVRRANSEFDELTQRVKDKVKEA